ncbi:uncharacterized protein TNCV_5041691 [Trichonephila clavipes]|nr:uncharacterized protein TNCV_5041691 [Trichonephila clavipes]
MECPVQEQNPPDILRCYALETNGVRYPNSERLHVYMDGSLFDDYLTACSGVFSNLFSFYASAEKFRAVFDGEVEAIQIALKQLLALEDKFPRVALYSDFQAIGSTNPS